MEAGTGEGGGERMCSVLGGWDVGGVRERPERTWYCCQVCVCLYIHVCVCVYTCVCIYMCVYVSEYSLVHASSAQCSAYIYIFTYIHTNMYSLGAPVRLLLRALHQ